MLEMKGFFYFSLSNIHKNHLAFHVNASVSHGCVCINHSCGLWTAVRHFEQADLLLALQDILVSFPCFPFCAALKVCVLLHAWVRIAKNVPLCGILKFVCFLLVSWDHLVSTPLLCAGYQPLDQVAIPQPPIPWEQGVYPVLTSLTVGWKTELAMAKLDNAWCCSPGYADSKLLQWINDLAFLGGLPWEFSSLPGRRGVGCISSMPVTWGSRDGCGWEEMSWMVIMGVNLWMLVVGGVGGPQACLPTGTWVCFPWQAPAVVEIQHPSDALEHSFISCYMSGQAEGLSALKAWMWEWAELLGGTHLSWRWSTIPRIYIWWCPVVLSLIMWSSQASGLQAVIGYTLRLSGETTEQPSLCLLGEVEAQKSIQDS